MSIALVDLWIGPDEGCFQRPPSAATKAQVLCGWASAEHDRRVGAVTLACELLAAGDDSLVVFPGWTIFGWPEGAIPPFLVELSQGRTIIFEQRGAPGAEGNWATRVVRDGEDVIAPARQHLAEGADPFDPNACAAFADDVLHGRRGWVDPRLGDALLLICGEANCIDEAGDVARTIRRHGVALNHVQRSVIANPSHTSLRPEAVSRKRGVLSMAPGVLVQAANCHPLGFDSSASGQFGASYTGCVAWAGGARAVPSPGSNFQFLNNPDWEDDDFRVARLDLAGG